MKLLNKNIKTKIFQFLDGEISLRDFEQWVYVTDALAEIFKQDDYLSLIALDYSQQSSRYELSQILQQYVDAGEYETWKIKKLLKTLISQQGDLASILSKFYELYCDGFYFLETLAIDYGLKIRVPPNSYSSESWQEFSDREQQEILEYILPDAIDKARQVLFWLERGQIIITDELDKQGHYIYVDHR